MNFTPLQHEAYLMATLEMLREDHSSTLDRIQRKVLFKDTIISPTFFSMLFEMVKIQDDKFRKILKILTKSCTLMNSNPSLLGGQFFEPEELFQLATNTNKIVDELWMLRKQQPAKMLEWKIKHRQIFQFRSKLLKLLETRFGGDWVQD